MMRAFFLYLLLIPTHILASDDHDHDNVLIAVQEHDLLPFSSIIQIVESQFEGRLIEAELENEHGKYVYELKVITDAGKMIEIELDAMSGAVLEVELDD